MNYIKKDKATKEKGQTLNLMQTIFCSSKSNQKKKNKNNNNKNKKKKKKKKKELTF